ncbi:MAG TPA: N-acetylglucosamine-6-phosphate deacetylase [Chthoniobacteraceae bacterium]|nr:N-acetylglucosamine-6-phosphate deacetylase [Chthoniobacteraceae bacterium]
MIFKNAKIIFPDRIEQGDVLVDGGRIANIGKIDTPGQEVIDLAGNYLAPGFIDLHIHGAMSRDTMEGTLEAFEAICNYHAAGGTTSLLLTTTTASTEEIIRVLNAVKQTKDARILGVHVEGPYISREKPGAQTPRYIRNPDPAETERILAHADVIKRMTLAPELPGALELIDALQARGICASGGHSDAWDEDARAAFARGMRQVTHTFNCMSSARRRGMYRVAGLLEFAMSEPGVLCELIADDRHVSATLMRMLYRAKGADGICLVTDATAGAGLPEGEKFRLAEVDCVVRDAVGVTADGKALAGSTANMIRLVRNMVNIVGAPLHEAVRMATLNPARAIGIEARNGVIAEGADADLVALSTGLDVVQTYAGGRPVFSR